MTKRLSVSMDDERYEDFRRLASEKSAPMAGLARFAIDKTFEDELDVVAATRGTEENLTDRRGAITLDDLLREHGIELLTRAKRARR